MFLSIFYTLNPLCLSIHFLLKIFRCFLLLKRTTFPHSSFPKKLTQTWSVDLTPLPLPPAPRPSSIHMKSKSKQRRYFKTFKEPKNLFQWIDSASLCSLAGRYDNPIPIRFLAPIDCSKIAAQENRHPLCHNSYKTYLQNHFEVWG